MKQGELFPKPQRERNLGLEAANRNAQQSLQSLAEWLALEAVRKRLAQLKPTPGFEDKLLK